jgi:LCP family protein required for cell wall assembly
LIDNEGHNKQQRKKIPKLIRQIIVNRSTSSKWLGILLLIIGVGGAAITGYGIRDAFRKELDKPLGPTLVPYPTLAQGAAGMEETPVVVQSSTLASETDTSKATIGENSKLEHDINSDPAPEPLCGGPDSMMVLVIGIDTSEAHNVGLSDAIRAVRIDFAKPEIHVLAFPRDLWVTIPGLDEYGVNEGKVNTAFLYGNAYQKPSGGPSILAQTLYLNFGLRVDHYVAINTSIFVEVIDKLGGIDMYLTGRIDGTSIGLSYSPSGWYHFSGEQALDFVSLRAPDSDWHRIDRQSDVLMAVRKKALQPGTLAKIPSLVDTFLDNVITDLSLNEIGKLSCLLPKIEDDGILSIKIERELVTEQINSQGMYVMIPHEDDIRKLVEDFQLGRLVVEDN